MSFRTSFILTIGKNGPNTDWHDTIFLVGSNKYNIQHGPLWHVFVILWHLQVWSMDTTFYGQTVAAHITSAGERQLKKKSVSKSMPLAEFETSRNMLLNLQVQQSARCDDTCMWSTGTTTTKQCSSKVIKITGKDNSSVVADFFTEKHAHTFSKLQKICIRVTDQVATDSVQQSWFLRTAKMYIFFL